jgi:hypothetical protein
MGSAEAETGKLGAMNKPLTFEPVAPLEVIDGMCLHESSHTSISSNAEGAVRSVLVDTSRMAMHAVGGVLEVRFSRYAVLHPGMATQVRR